MRPRFAGGAVDLRPEEIVRLEEDRVVLLDQRHLPDEEVEVECRSAAEVAEAIRTMVIRGAPAIGVAAAYGYALAASRGDDLDEAAEVLLASRPTAVNLPWAVEQMQQADGDLGERARDLHRAEVEHCRRMGEHAAGLLSEGSTPLTHCNAGGLATGGYGSAQQRVAATGLSTGGLRGGAGNRPIISVDVGDRVSHDAFGLGTVVEINGAGDKAQATVDFGSGGTKRLVLRYAPLVKL